MAGMKGVTWFEIVYTSVRSGVGKKRKEKAKCLSFIDVNSSKPGNVILIFFRGEAVDSNVPEQVQMAKELLANLVDALREKAKQVNSARLILGDFEGNYANVQVLECLPVAIIGLKLI